MTRILFVSALLLAAGCKKTAATFDDGASAEAFRPAIVERVLPEGLILEEVDLDKDGVPDIFNKWRERTNASRLLVERQTDQNHDGRIDNTLVFDNTTGMLLTEASDRDFDGQVDTWGYYQDVNGDGKPERVKSEFDTDGDGIANEYVFYRKGQVVRKERDTNGDGRIDEWEKFGEDGTVVKSGRDMGPDYDGSVDERWD